MTTSRENRHVTPHACGSLSCDFCVDGDGLDRLIEFRTPPAPKLAAPTPARSTRGPRPVAEVLERQDAVFGE